VAAILRIFATLVIFVYHCEGRFSRDVGAVLGSAFAIFLFLTGFYARIRETERPCAWILRRLQRIYPPYWITVIGVVVANYIFKYKSIDWLTLVVLGRRVDWLHPSPLYSIAWYVTLIVLIYLSLFAFYSARGTPLKIIVTVITAVGLKSIGSATYFLIAFLVEVASSFTFTYYHLSEYLITVNLLPSERIL
jgi:fucose 4-O-acetylase-like acetyltransferase